MKTGHQLAVAFYARVPHDPVLMRVYGPSQHCAIKSLGAYLEQLLGGPCEYSETRWSLSLREAHLRFKIGREERDAWLRTMNTVLQEVELDASVRERLRHFFDQFSAHLVNTEQLTPHPADLGEWTALRMIEEAVAAVRQGHSLRALELTGGPVLQAHFTRDRGALQSLLAIMSGSGNRALVDHVCNSLRNDPALGRDRFTYGRTLLHEVNTNAPVVKLLLELGADPNAADRFGHTPLHMSKIDTVVHALAKGGADLNARDKAKRCTALHIAARRGYLDVARALIDCGADLEARDRNGVTPLRRAMNCRKPELVNLLKSRGARDT